MKKFFQLAFITCLFLLIIINPGKLISGEIQVYFSSNVFNTPGNNPFVETYLTVNGNSVVFKKLPNGKYQGTIEITLTLHRKDSVFFPKKYNLLSPEISDTLKRPNFIDQQRISVPEGIYALEINVCDLNSPSKKKISNAERVEIVFPKDKINISDIQLVESFKKTSAPSILTKSGYDLIPYVVNSFNDQMTRLSFYCEAYNSEVYLGTNKRFAFFYYLENYFTKEKVEGFAGFSKQTSSPVNVLLSQLELQKLKPGEYNLVVEIKDESNNLIALKKVPFNRKSSVEKNDMMELSYINPDSSFMSYMKNADTLVDYIRCLWPVSSFSQRDYAANQIKQKDVRLMQKFIVAFWNTKNPSDPEGAWKKYKKQVDVVQEIFAAGKVKGYATDRGRVYLQYGTPDSRQSVNSEPDTYPYEIWQYYKMLDPVTGVMQTNKRFVFLDNELAGNNYKLIHSEARGETNDVRWRYKVMKRTVQSMNLDDEKVGPTYGSGLDENFTVPK